MSHDNYIIIEDYFEVKQRVSTIEEKNKELEERLKHLEQVIYKYMYDKEHPGIIKKVSKAYGTAFGYYEKIKLINLVLLFFFSNKILSEPKLLIKIYNLLKHSIFYLYSS
jgi:hypothetical protein